MPGSVDDFVTSVVSACAMSLRIAAITAITASVAAADEMALPPLGFFDYLGSMVESEGELIDPLSLQATMNVAQGAEAEPPVQEELPGGRGTANNSEEVQ